VQDNQICTLKGSLLTFKFLEVLDLSNNLLRNLDKLMVTLSKLKYLKSLNLMLRPLTQATYKGLVGQQHVSVAHMHALQNAHKHALQNAWREPGTFTTVPSLCMSHKLVFCC